MSRTAHPGSPMPVPSPHSSAHSPWRWADIGSRRGSRIRDGSERAGSGHSRCEAQSDPADRRKKHDRLWQQCFDLRLCKSDRQKASRAVPRVITFAKGEHSKAQRRGRELSTWRSKRGLLRVLFIKIADMNINE